MKKVSETSSIEVNVEMTIWILLLQTINLEKGLQRYQQLVSSTNQQDIGRVPSLEQQQTLLS